MIKFNDILINVGKFPNNESYIDFEITREMKEKNNFIFFKFENDAEFMYLKFLKDFLVDNGIENISLIMPYIPYSRMDRKEEKRLFTLKSVARFINDLNFKKVVVWEPHSEVSVALFDRIEVKNTTYDIAMKLMYQLSDLANHQEKLCVDKNPYEVIKEECSLNDVYLIYPDNGAAKRYEKQFKYEKFITCKKNRDFNTGRINSLELELDNDCIKPKIAIIVDDLSSRGGTFQLTAQKLKDELAVEKIFLVVTHCENTIFDGEVLTGNLIEAVYTTDSILSADKKHEKLFISKRVEDLI